MLKDIQMLEKVQRFALRGNYHLSYGESVFKHFFPPHSVPLVFGSGSRTNHAVFMHAVIPLWNQLPYDALL